MTIERRVKIGLDETRLLSLGASVLLGFQFNAPFQNAFEELPTSSRYLDALALVLMVASIGFLIAPSTYHRLAEDGQASGSLLRLISTMAGLALLPFALALGLDIYLVLDHAVGTVSGLAGGFGFFLGAMWCWYGLGYLRRAQYRENSAMPEHRQTPPLETRIDHMLTEARILLPGAQALLGFQFVIMLTSGFEGLPYSTKLVHVAALGFICIAVVMLMTPAAYHRIVHNGDITDDTLRVGSRLVAISCAPLALGIAADVYVVVSHIGSFALGFAAAGFSIALLLSLWFVFPWVAAARRRK